MRAAGVPSPPTVASVIAVGSGSFAAMACCSQDPNWRSGSGSTSVSEREARLYSRRRSAMFKAAVICAPLRCPQGRNSRSGRPCGFGAGTAPLLSAIWELLSKSRVAATRASEGSAENQTLEQPALRLHRIDHRPARRVAVVGRATQAVVVEAEHRAGRGRALQDVGGDIKNVALKDPGCLRLERVAFEVECRVEMRVEADSRPAEEAAHGRQAGANVRIRRE